LWNLSHRVNSFLPFSKISANSKFCYSPMNFKITRFSCTFSSSWLTFFNPRNSRSVKWISDKKVNIIYHKIILFKVFFNICHFSCILYFLSHNLLSCTGKPACFCKACVTGQSLWASNKVLSWATSVLNRPISP
jgi:hypothetical protein